MREAEQRGLAYLFRIRMIANLRRAIGRAANGLRADAGRSWQGKSIEPRLDGWSREADQWPASQRGTGGAAS